MRSGAPFRVEFADQAPRLTFVVPFWNTVTYLPKCLASLETHVRFGGQVLLIDDGSTDGSSSVAESWAARFAVPLLRQSNSGLGAARNRGLAEVQTPFVSFLDSDDWIEPPVYWKSVAFSREWGAQATFCRLTRVQTDGRRSDRLGLSQQPPRLVDPRRAFDETLGVTLGVYDRYWLGEQKLRFQEIRRLEDVAFTYVISQRASRIGINPDIGYAYLVGRADQLTAEVPTPTEIAEVLNSAADLARLAPSVDLWEWKLRHVAGSLRRSSSQLRLREAAGVALGQGADMRMVLAATMRLLVRYRRALPRYVRLACGSGKGWTQDV